MKFKWSPELLPHFDRTDFVELRGQYLCRGLGICEEMSFLNLSLSAVLNIQFPRSIKAAPAL
jgi:hypothetical protein